MSATESEEGDEKLDFRKGFLQEFKLYETQSNFYMIGSDENGRAFRVLKIDRLDHSNLNITEDHAVYSHCEYNDLLNRIHEGNRSTGGLKFITTCYGIVGFIKFLGSYYMLLITERRQIGNICGHKVYAIDNSKLIPISSPTVQTNLVNTKDENRYKKLLYSMDLKKDFFFSYSYNLMHSLQKNLCEDETNHVFYESMFVWNDFLTREIRNHLKNTHWTIALVHGFFEQCKLSISGKDFQLTLIARRSRNYAGTRYLKRGLDEKGRVANEVETEQIVSEGVSKGYPAQISSIVQNRGSIPLFWSQDNSRLNIKPGIILLKKDTTYEATRLHFENLVSRYGNPIIIWNLIKANENKPRESILRAEFAHAIDFINKNLPQENQLKYLHWDLSTHHQLSNVAEVFLLMDKVATYTFSLTGFFYCQVTPTLKLKEAMKCGSHKEDRAGTVSQHHSNYTRDNISEFGIQQDTVFPERGNEDAPQGTTCRLKGEDLLDVQEREPLADPTTGLLLHSQDTTHVKKNYLIKTHMLQKGVLRTNCIDCLDRTNVAQCLYGWAALLHQLHALGYIDAPRADSNGSLANELTKIYERMGDSLSWQYGGSPALNKLFSERRGEWKATIRSQEILRTVQRYYSNEYLDAEKQNAIYVFLGHFQPQQGKPALWELDLDNHCNVGMHAQNFAHGRASFFKRSLSDGHILHESNAPGPDTSVRQTNIPSSALPDGKHQEGANRFTSIRTQRQLSYEMQREGSFGSDFICLKDRGLGDSNFLDLEWLTSSGTSFGDETHGSSSTDSSNATLSSENTINDKNLGTSPPSSNNLSIMDLF